MLDKRTSWRGAAAAAGALLIAFAAFSSAADILDDWDSVKAPPKPELKAATVEPKTTALLVLDMQKRNCGARPRCAPTVANVKRLVDSARAAGMMLWYSITKPEDIIDQGIMPREGEWEEQGGPDKFLGSTLEEKLKAHNIKTVIVCGTSFQGVGIGTASAAAQRGYNVIVPIDCLSSENSYVEQYAAWHLYKGGPNGITKAVTLTRSSMVKF